MLADPSFKRGARESAILFFTTGVFGTAYGVLALEAGLEPWLTILSSMIIVSGAAQFAMVGLMAAGPLPVLLSAAGLGLRHVPMSVSLSAMIGDRPLWTRLRMAWVLVDESFGLTVRAHANGVEDIVAYKTAADIMLYGGWVTGTVLGVLFGASMDPEALGVGVFFPLLFLGLAAPMVTSRRDLVVVAVAVVTTLVTVATLPTAWEVSAAATIAAAVGAFLRE